MTSLREVRLENLGKEENDMPRKGETRAPHKEGCMCAVCVKKRAKLESPILVKPTAVRLDTLNTRELFELNGKRYRVGEKTPECVVCNQLSWLDNGPLPTDKMWRVVQTVSLGTSTVVKPIK